MICFDVFLNGKKLCRAGLREALVLTCIVDWVKLPSDGEEMSLHVGGLYETPGGGNALPNWIKRLPLSQNDEITIRIVDSEISDEPASETVWTAEDLRNSERQYFESVRAKFENDQPLIMAASLN